MTSEELQQFSDTNWQRIDYELRLNMLEDLRQWIGSDVLNEWHQNGLPDWFHFGAGMQIRNRLRNHLKDDQLPIVQYLEGPFQNWDDYYMGAVRELLL